MSLQPAVPSGEPILPDRSGRVNPGPRGWLPRAQWATLGRRYDPRGHCGWRRLPAMSEEFEVQGPHDRVIEDAIERGVKDRFVSRLAVTTAILATIGARVSYQGGATQAVEMA